MSYFINHVDKKPGRSESTSGFFAVFLSMISLYSAYIQPIFSQGHSCHLQDLDL